MVGSLCCQAMDMEYPTSLPAAVCPTAVGKRPFHSEAFNPTVDGIKYTAESALPASHFREFSALRLRDGNLGLLIRGPGVTGATHEICRFKATYSGARKCDLTAPVSRAAIGLACWQRSVLAYSVCVPLVFPVSLPIMTRQVGCPWASKRPRQKLIRGRPTTQ